MVANDQINFFKVRVVNEANGYVGDFSSSEALNLARSKKQDLILVSGTTVPPICKIGCLKRHIADAIGIRNAPLERSFVAFDPGRGAKYVRFTGKEDEVAFNRKVKMSRDFLAQGVKTTLVFPTHPSAPVIAEKIRQVAIELKSVGVAAAIPNRVAEIARLPQILLEFKPCKADAVGTSSLESLKISPIVYDDEPSDEPKVAKKQKRKLNLPWAKVKSKRIEQLKEEREINDGFWSEVQ